MTAAGVADEPTWSSIGVVMARLKPDFPDVTISKIRFLESEGLITPRRTPSGYRQFSDSDVDRLKFVLAAQRDHYLPLKVIKEQLDAIDRGQEPAGPPVRMSRTSSVAAAPADDAAPAAPASGVRMTRAELLAGTGLTATQLVELEHYGLLAPAPGDWFEAEAVQIAAVVAELLAAGLEARHLRSLRTAAEREASLVAQLVAAQARQQRDPDARERAGAAAAGLAATTSRLHGHLVRASLRRELGR
ncbi:transcriptional regulator FtsR [Nakamurella leprariae]|uniref:MerR family transcriptional regulator n=1 Tax=Nakamurella leprariae TaxID=2803911 RepID=A0A939C3K9_9ACTN|nr:MerR family transcriptional regulator [Nakamurella leprariae]MBM9469197.1 MerR family transcriptional regulator [Nakamurella leprariae]